MTIMWRTAALSLFLVLPAFASEKLTAPQLIELANHHSESLRDAIPATFDEKNLKEGRNGEWEVNFIGNINVGGWELSRLQKVSSSIRLRE